MTIDELRFEAMTESDHAFAMLKKGNHEAAKAAFARACTLQTQAAEQNQDSYSRASYYESAAWLALYADDPRCAIALADKGLEQSPAGLFTFGLNAVREAAEAALRKEVTP